MKIKVFFSPIRVQDAGVGGLRHNTVLINWPTKWRQEKTNYKFFIGVLVFVYVNKNVCELTAKTYSVYPV